MIGFDHRARRRVLDEVQPHWGAVATLAAAAISAYAQNQASKKAAASSAASDLAGKQGGTPPPFQSVASQFAKPPGQGFDGDQRVQDGLSQENQQNEQRLRALEVGRPVSSVFSQAGAPPPAQQPPAYMGGRQVDPSGQYSMSSVPQTTEPAGLGVGDYAKLIGAASQLGGAMRPQPPPPVAPQPGMAPNYQPTAIAQLQALLASRQRRNF